MTDFVQSSNHPLFYQVQEACKTVYDPEIPINIFDLGLIYQITIDDDNNTTILMSLTSPACPVAGELPEWIKEAVCAVPSIGSVVVDLTFDPPWGLSHMSEEAKLELGLM